MTKERIEKELSKVRGQLADLQEKQKDLESQLQMAEDAEKMKFIEKNKISLDRLILLNKVSEEEILSLLRKKEQEVTSAAIMAVSCIGCGNTDVLPEFERVSPHL